MIHYLFIQRQHTKYASAWETLPQGSSTSEFLQLEAPGLGVFLQMLGMDSSDRKDRENPLAAMSHLSETLMGGGVISLSHVRFLGRVSTAWLVS